MVFQGGPEAYFWYRTFPRYNRGDNKVYFYCVQSIDLVGTCAHEMSLRYSNHAQNQNRTETHQAREGSAAQAQTLAGHSVLQGRGAVCSRVYGPGKGRQICGAATEVSRRKDRESIASRLIPLSYTFSKAAGPGSHGPTGVFSGPCLISIPLGSCR